MWGNRGSTGGREWGLLRSIIKTININIIIILCNLYLHLNVTSIVNGHHVACIVVIKERKNHLKKNGGQLPELGQDSGDSEHEAGDQHL